MKGQKLFPAPGRKNLLLVVAIPVPVIESIHVGAPHLAPVGAHLYLAAPRHDVGLATLHQLHDIAHIKEAAPYQHHSPMYLATVVFEIPIALLIA